MKTITVVIDVFDDSTSEDIERAVSAGLDSNGIDCIYNVEEREDENVDLFKARSCIIT